MTKPKDKHLLQEVLRFFKDLIEGMGENVKFKVDGVCEGDELIAAAKWHLGNFPLQFTHDSTLFLYITNHL